MGGPDCAEVPCIGRVGVCWWDEVEVLKMFFNMLLAMACARQQLTVSAVRVARLFVKEQ